MNIIETQNLSHRYWRTEALRDLTLAVPTGSVFALLGANGAGKTTAIKVLMNLLRPSAGVARVLGVDSHRLGEQELAQIGYVSENQQLPLWMTVRQLLDYCRPFYPTWDRKLKQLSRGMLMKAALLSSLAYRPKLLVLDEPFSGLDPLVREEFVHGLLETARLGDWTVFISSHDIEEVERLADHIALLEAGRLRFTETTESLLGRFRRIEVEMEGVASAENLPASWLGWRSEAGRISFFESAYQRDVTERACRERFPAATVQAHPMTLREIFIALARAKQTALKGTAA
jgi:ABC-2 type transport system ATP-binding protein